MNFKTGDKVVVIAGKDKGKEGKITKILRADNKVIVEGANIVKKHVKPSGNQPGSIIEVEAPIHISNVKVLDKSEKKKEKKETKVKEVKETKTKKASKKKEEKESK